VTSWVDFEVNVKVVVVGGVFKVRDVGIILSKECRCSPGVSRYLFLDIPTTEL